MDTEKSKELWDRLDNESERAHRAFQTFLSLPSDDRTVVEAYRGHVGNPQAVKPSDTWVRWSREYAWAERASAHDHHLESMRRRAFERGIEEEAERQGVLAERNRNRFNELMTMGYEAAMRSLEGVAEEGGMRPAEAIQITRLHLEAVKTLGVAAKPEGEDDWTEEDDAEFADLLKEMQAEAAPEEGPCEDPPEESEGKQLRDGDYEALRARISRQRIYADDLSRDSGYYTGKGTETARAFVLVDGIGTPVNVLADEPLSDGAVHEWAADALEFFVDQKLTRMGVIFTRETRHPRPLSTMLGEVPYRPRLTPRCPDLETALWFQFASLIGDKRPLRECSECHETFVGPERAKTCSDRCRKAKSRRRGRQRG